MFRIRRIYDNALAIDQDAITEAQRIMRLQFSDLPDEAGSDLLRKLADPLKYRLRTILFVANDHLGRIKGFAILNHAPDLHFCYLDFISVDLITSGGVGGALYSRVQDEARRLQSVGIFFECLPDDPTLCSDKTILKQNKARLRFYERFGVFPIINTKYETPLEAGGQNPPYLLFDGLGKTKTLSAEYAKKAVHAILTRKYGKLCSEEYNTMVIDSFVDDPVKLRAPRYLKADEKYAFPQAVSIDTRIALIVNEGHEIHHIHERGYVEAPVRISSIQKGIMPTGLFDTFAARDFPEKYIKAVHKGDFVEYLKRMCQTLEYGKSVYPYVFPIRNAAKPPKEMPVRAGYYCIDTFTPLNRNAYPAARAAANCALTAAHQILAGYRIS
ncbi:MAG: acetylpolyamine amidohydrolase, partial [Desulfocapsaceae bacterium]|nr:acetylpolyamine amidohydrolase [Desulfocapsaceae bacterium]